MQIPASNVKRMNQVSKGITVRGYRPYTPSPLINFSIASTTGLDDTAIFFFYQLSTHSPKYCPLPNRITSQIIKLTFYRWISNLGVQDRVQQSPK